MPVTVFDAVAAMLTLTGPLSSMKLQRLLCYAQGWHLARHGKPLFREVILSLDDGLRFLRPFARSEGLARS